MTSAFTRQPRKSSLSKNVAVIGQPMPDAELCMICLKRGPVNFECDHPDAHTPLPTTTHDANGEPYAEMGELVSRLRAHPW